MKKHLVLVGDSVFDNKVYTGGEPSVTEHLRAALSEGDDLTLLAVDGSMTVDVAAQLQQLPTDATHVIVSLGGNDALDAIDVLSEPASNVAEALVHLSRRTSAFEARYAAAIAPLRNRGLELAVCTIYDGNLDGSERLPAHMALRTFNDFIIRYAALASIPVLDLRLICTEPEDYANPIEPSGRGGSKIAQAILRLFGVLERETPQAELHF